MYESPLDTFLIGKTYAITKTMVSLENHYTFVDCVGQFYKIRVES